MRALFIVAALTACTPDIVPGSYLCGPNAGCPEDQVCSEDTNTCVLPGLTAPFACEPDLDSEPDDSVDTGFQLMNLSCQTLPVVIDACMPTGDSADWYRLAAPSGCAGLEVDARITFPIAFQRLGLELVDIATGQSLATDTACQFQGESGDDLRCLAATLTPGASYGIHVAPNGDGDCDGRCAFNRYTLRIQLGPPN